MEAFWATVDVANCDRYCMYIKHLTNVVSWVIELEGDVTG